jgi:hypothetical protein
MKLAGLTIALALFLAPGAGAHPGAHRYTCQKPGSTDWIQGRIKVTVGPRHNSGYEQRGLVCDWARDIVRSYFQRPRRRVLGFRCHDHDLGYEHSFTVCRLNWWRAALTFSFEWGL